jgi:hypothetical protein
MHQPEHPHDVRSHVLFDLQRPFRAPGIPDRSGEEAQAAAVDELQR